MGQRYGHFYGFFYAVPYCIPKGFNFLKTSSEMNALNRFFIKLKKKKQKL